MHVLLSSEHETYNLGVKIAGFLRGGEVILLIGEIGAGKTSLAKGIAKGLGVVAEISSPTFTLLNVYHGRLTMYHYDLFRVASVEEAEEAGLTEFFGDKTGVCVIEWPDKLPSMFDGFDTVNVTMKYIVENTREAVVSWAKTGENGWDKL